MNKRGRQQNAWGRGGRATGGKGCGWDPFEVAATGVCKRKLGNRRLALFSS